MTIVYVVCGLLVLAGLLGGLSVWADEPDPVLGPLAAVGIFLASWFIVGLILSAIWAEQDRIDLLVQEHRRELARSGP